MNYGTNDERGTSLLVTFHLQESKLKQTHAICSLNIADIASIEKHWEKSRLKPII